MPSRPRQGIERQRAAITPERLGEILCQLHALKDDVVDDTLADLRGQIDQTDDELMALIQRRMEIAREIGAFKKARKMTVVQPGRYGSLMTRRVAEAESHGLSPDFVRNLLALIHEESVRQQLS